MRALRFCYTFPTGFVQPFPKLETGKLQFPILWGYCASATLPTQAEVDTFTDVASTTPAASISYTSGGHTTKHLVVLVPLSLGTASSVSATTVTMVTQTATATFTLDDTIVGYDLIYKVYVSSGLISSSGTLTVVA